LPKVSSKWGDVTRFKIGLKIYKNIGRNLLKKYFFILSYFSPPTIWLLEPKRGKSLSVLFYSLFSLHFLSLSFTHFLFFLLFFSLSLFYTFTPYLYSSPLPHTPHTTHTTHTLTLLKHSTPIQSLHIHPLPWVFFLSRFFYFPILPISSLSLSHTHTHTLSLSLSISFISVMCVTYFSGMHFQ